MEYAKTSMHWENLVAYTGFAIVLLMIFWRYTVAAVSVSHHLWRNRWYVNIHDFWDGQRSITQQICVEAVKEEASPKVTSPAACILLLEKERNALHIKRKVLICIQPIWYKKKLAIQQFGLNVIKVLNKWYTSMAHEMILLPKSINVKLN